MKKEINAEQTIRMLALQEGKTVEYINSQIRLAIISGLSNPDPQVQGNWKKIPSKGTIPTPEELIAYLGTVPFV